MYCLVFGALISPTDPIAVLGILKTAHAPRSLEMKIAGESLFNDGIGVVAFLITLEAATGSRAVQPGQIGWFFVQEALGGAMFGLCIGYIAYRMLRAVENYQVELLITLALVTGGYSLANVLHLSGPIAIVVAGLLIGNKGRLLAMSEKTRQHLDIFWELVDEVLNALLFVLIGLEVLVLTFTHQYLLAGLLIIPAVLFSRFVAVGTHVTMLRPFREFSPGAIRILTWGGLRGGISVAMALSLPLSPERDVIVALTYAVVVFSILVQGLTIGRIVKKIISAA
jgi:CPA1 family monovalent cation:H+ antiporter